MKTVLACLGGVLSCLGGLRSQAVVLDGGESLAGTVVAVTDNRVSVRGADGALQRIAVRRVECEVALDGSVRRFHASLRDGELDPVERGVLEQVRQGEEVPFPQRMRVTERCSHAFVEALQGELAHGNATVRVQAAQLLAVTAVPGAVKAVLDAAVADPSGRLLATIAGCWNATSLGALEAAHALPLLEQGLSHQDADVRFALAWLAARLGSDAALPVLARCLGDRDHHVRESAAVSLAERGDAAGVGIVLTIAKRDRAPVQTANRTADAATRALVDRLALRERCHACELLGKLRHQPALPVLRRLAGHKDATLAAAASAAITAITADH
ncbi:MAG: HEAT repeat domain-containing protein [Planctomycetes bacterium]|nr:HEAT repeat domain-containing protein [Planctomycetota bacterium]